MEGREEGSMTALSTALEPGLEPQTCGVVMLPWAPYTHIYIYLVGCCHLLAGTSAAESQGSQIGGGVFLDSSTPEDRGLEPEAYGTESLLDH